MNLTGQSAVFDTQCYRHISVGTRKYWGSIRSPKWYTARARGAVWNKPMNEIYESKDRGGGQAGEHDVTALPTLHISRLQCILYTFHPETGH